MSSLSAFLLALFFSLIATPLAVRVAWAVGYLDHPEARKLHTSATALLGGVAVFVCAIAAWGITWWRGGASGAGPEAGYLLGGALVALALGMWDDRFGMQPAPKMFGQLLAAGALLVSGVTPDFGLAGPAEEVLLLFGMVALMNAVNFLDNMNGMVGGLSAIVLAAFAWHSAGRGAWGVAAAQLAIAGGCVGFLPYNFPKARIFLGDAGSLFLGYSLGASAVLAFSAAPAGWARLGAPLMLAYPFFDLVFVVVNRLREGRKVYEGGKDHSNHRLASVIRCPKRTVLLLWFSTAALCASGLAVLSLNQAAPTLLLWGLWTILLCWLGLRLSSVPVSRPHPTPTPAR